MGVVPTYLTGMVWGCPSLLLARCCEILWRKVQYRKKCTRKEIHQLNLKMMSVGAPQEYKYGWNLTKVVKIKSLLILHSGGIHLTSDPFPVIGKDFNGSWTKPLSISEGSCYFFFFLNWWCYYLLFLRYWDQMACIIHMHPFWTLQCNADHGHVWHWLYWLSVCYFEVCMLLNKWDWRKKHIHCDLVTGQ